MATIRTRKGKYGTVYRAEVCVKGRRESASFDKQSAALAWAEHTENLLRSGQPLPGEANHDDMLIEDAVDKYIAEASPAKKINTRRLDREIGKRILSHFAGKTLSTISQVDIAGYRDSRLQKVGSSSIIQDLSFLRCLYRKARVDWGKKVDDPTIDIRRPASPKNRLSLLTRAEIDRLLDWCCVSKSENLYCYVLLQLHTAMRPSEGAGLQWGRVLLNQGIIDLTETKTDPRRVPMTSTVQAMLTKMHSGRDHDNPFVFLPKKTKLSALPHRFFRRSFSTACKSAGIDNFSLYGLRHSAASYLIMNGVDIRTVADIMGHRSISQTMKYTHFLDAHKLAAINAINAIGL